MTDLKDDWLLVAAAAVGDDVVEEELCSMCDRDAEWKSEKTEQQKEGDGQLCGCDGVAGEEQGEKEAVAVALKKGWQQQQRQWRRQTRQRNGPFVECGGLPIWSSYRGISYFPF